MLSLGNLCRLKVSQLALVTCQVVVNHCHLHVVCSSLQKYLSSSFDGFNTTCRIGPVNPMPVIVWVIFRQLFSHSLHQLPALRSQIQYDFSPPAPLEV